MKKCTYSGKKYRTGHQLLIGMRKCCHKDMNAVCTYEENNSKCDKAEFEDRDIIIKMDHVHAGYILDALDLYSRLGMGQVERLSELFKFKDEKRFEKIKEKVLSVDKEEEEEILAKLKEYYFPDITNRGYYGIFNDQTPEYSKIAYDIIQVLRFKIAWARKPEGGSTVDFGPPLPSSKAKLVDVKVKK